MLSISALIASYLLIKRNFLIFNFPVSFLAKQAVRSKTDGKFRGMQVVLELDRLKVLMAERQITMIQNVSKNIALLIVGKRLVHKKHASKCGSSDYESRVSLFHFYYMEIAMKTFK